MLAIVTDGSAEADALAEWLVDRGAGGVVCSALGPDDAVAIAEARRRAGQRIVLLHDDARSDVAAGRALEVVREWLAALGPFERRSRGIAVIEERMTGAQHGHAELERLCRRLAVPGTRAARARASAKPRKRGRPAGTDPFRGVGLDVCVRLLLEPSRTWTERQLASATERSPHAVHRVLAELGSRGYVETPRGAARLVRATALREDLAAAWAARVSANRIGRGLVAPRACDAAEIVRLLDEAGCDAFLAGPSALPAARSLRGGAIVLYAESGADRVLGERSFRPTRGAPDVVVWPIEFEHAIRSAPRAVDGVPATNLVITYLDLVASGIDRHIDAARALWDEGAP